MYVVYHKYQVHLDLKVPLVGLVLQVLQEFRDLQVSLISVYTYSHWINYTIGFPGAKGAIGDNGQYTISSVM